MEPAPSRTTTALTGCIVGLRYKILYKIWEGASDDVYNGLDIVTKQQVAIKVEEKMTKYPQLEHEYRIYRAMAESPGVPTVYWCGSFQKYRCLVMDLLGDNLEVLYRKCNRQFTLKTVVQLAVQMLDRIEHMHGNLFIHRDIKPDNFVMGLSPKSHILYIVDMGLSKRYRDPDSWCHVPLRTNKKLTGTPRYCSHLTHKGLEQSRRDDLESMGYMLIYFLKGALPWQGLKARTKQEKYDRIGLKKEKTTVEELCKGQPEEFQLYFRAIRRLQFRESPNYTQLRSFFYSIFRRLRMQEDFIFDWMTNPTLKADAVQAMTKPTKKLMPAGRYRSTFVTGGHWDNEMDGESLPTTIRSGEDEELKRLAHEYDDLLHKKTKQAQETRSLTNSLTYVARMAGKFAQCLENEGVPLALSELAEEDAQIMRQTLAQKSKGGSFSLAALGVGRNRDDKEKGHDSETKDSGKRKRRSANAVAVETDAEAEAEPGVGGSGTGQEAKEELKQPGKQKRARKKG